MNRIHSVLWVGRAEALEAHAVSESPLLDVAWARDAEDAAALPLSAFDALVIDAENERRARETLTRLRVGSRGVPPALVLLPVLGTTSEVALRSAGAAAVAARRGEGAERPPLSVRVASLVDGATAGGRPGVPADAATPGLIARSPAMRDVLALVDRARSSHATLLLTGETGTGKEVLARAVHAGSPRSKRGFVALNCAAFPDTLLESELFGHVRGAFTGADRNKPGLFETAEGGTLLLDEVGETSPSFQAKLLRALQEREVRPVGGARPRKVDVRVIAATNRALRSEVARGRFREDLYYRLAVFRIAVPPLRERPEDVLPLAEHFLRRHGESERKPGCHVAREAAALLLAHPWPGNVRELENEMQRALALAEPGEWIAVRHLSDRLQETLRPLREAAPRSEHEPLRAQVARVEAWLIRRALDAHGGQRTATARALGLTREGLYKKMRRLGIE